MNSSIVLERNGAPLSLALLGNGFIGWGGGIDFLRFCAHSLSYASRDHNIKLSIILPDPEYKSTSSRLKAAARPIKNKIKSFLGQKQNNTTKKSPEFTQAQLIDSFSNIDGSIDIIFYHSSNGLNKILKRNKVDVVIPSMYPLGVNFEIPWVGYLYDFQHKYYPDFFQDSLLAKRELQFQQMLAEARAIIVNAMAVKDDIFKFHPQTKCRVFHLPFSATPIESWFEPAEEGLAEKYSLPDKYFIISNQFWVHKDHRTAFKAMAIFLKSTGNRDIHLVCTGKTEDFRCPDHFSSLQEDAIALGIDNNIHYLGHIPKKDQIDILKGSIALLQPTLFEGGPGGGAVYDAVAMGVPAILSDIPVNREITGERGLFYFTAGDESSLAAKMIEILNKNFKRPDKKQLLERGQARTANFGSSLLEAAVYVKKIWHDSQ